MQLQEVMRDNTTLKRRIEAMEADVQRRTDTDRDKFSVRVSSPNTGQLRWHTQHSDLTGKTCGVRHSILQWCSKDALISHLVVILIMFTNINNTICCCCGCDDNQLLYNTLNDKLWWCGRYIVPLTNNKHWLSELRHQASLASNVYSMYHLKLFFCFFYIVV